MLTNLLFIGCYKKKLIIFLYKLGTFYQLSCYHISVECNIPYLFEYHMYTIFNVCTAGCGVIHLQW
jgi:hypothetical protein